jgi:phospholipid transport system substrate-binding protein
MKSRSSGSGRWRSVRSGLGLALALLLGGAPAVATPADDARATMEKTVADVLIVLDDSALSLQTKRDRIQAIAFERFDFVTMSKLVLKRDWKKFDTAQQQEFVEQFREHLSARYGENLGKYDNEKVEVTTHHTETNGDVSVKTVIRGGKFDGTPVDYRLREGSGWQVIDVVIENVSLVSSFRTQFADVLAKSGPTGVLTKLKERNAARAAAKAKSA